MSREQVLLLHEIIPIFIFRLFIGIYRTFGLWPPPPDTLNSNRRTWYFFFAGLYHFFFTLIYISTMVINFLITWDFNDLYITFTEFGMLGKVYHFFKRHKIFQAYLKDLYENPIFGLQDQKEKEIYTRNLKNYRLIVIMYMSSCFLVIVAAPVTSYYSDPIVLSYPAWFPVDYSSRRNLAYYLIFVYQNIGMTVHCLINLTWDCIMPFLMVNLRSQFEVLNHRLEMGFKDPRNSVNAKQELINHVKHYNALVEWVWQLFHKSLWLIRF